MHAPADGPALCRGNFLKPDQGQAILEVNRQPVNSEEDFKRVTSQLKSGQDVVFLVRQRGAGRQGGTIFLAGTLP